ALNNAWNDACKWNGKGEAQILIPSGNYFLNPVQLSGPCKRPINFRNTGHLVAPRGPTKMSYWISFYYLNGLTINGGYFHGQGQTAWDRAQQIDPSHALLSLAFVNNTNIRRVKLFNSKKTHVNLFSCNNVEFARSLISAPETSPNTDGIKIAISSFIRIRDTVIKSGDDCVAILNGTNNLNVTRVNCGPGHGVSIGSMGGTPGDVVRQVTVTNCTFSRTLNGVRIKTWAKPNSGLVSGVSFMNIIMDRAFNPVIIDQNYCPSGQCPKGESRVQIKGVKFININGTSATKAALNLQCSGSNPCKDVRMDNIDLGYVGPGGGPATGLCTNVFGTATRVTLPGSCRFKKKRLI
ncbi:hypothetical protein V2J09_008024, partial [Rumex salicifolius]